MEERDLARFWGAKNTRNAGPGHRNGAIQDLWCTPGTLVITCLSES